MRGKLNISMRRNGTPLGRVTKELLATRSTCKIHFFFFVLVRGLLAVHQTGALVEIIILFKNL